MAELILLTRGTGMHGCRILIEALQSGFRVHAAVRNHGGVDKLQFNPLGAYDEAVKGVTAVVHVASPLPNPGITDFESQLIQPAIRGAVGMLESAMKSTIIRRIVITASIGSIVPVEKLLTGDSIVYNEKSVCPSTQGSFSNALDAYLGSKVTAFKAALDSSTKEKPTYDVINILPGYIIGRNDLINDVDHFLQGTNRIAFGQLLGQPSPHALPSTTAYLFDVAEAHVLSLSPSIQGNQNFVISSNGLHGSTWGDAIDIVRDHYSDDVGKAAGFNLDVGKTPTARISIDSTYSQCTLSF